MAYDQRTGLKVQGRKLKQDAEKGIWTTDPDPLHPQRFIRPPDPDGGYWRPGLPDNVSIGDDWVLKTHWWTIADGYQQRPMVRLVVPGGLREQLGDEFSIGAAINVAANPMTYDSVDDVEMGFVDSLEWGGEPLEWEGS